MPLGDGAAGVGQHVGPVFEPGPLALASHQDLPDSVVLADLVVVQHCDHSMDFLEGKRKASVTAQALSTNDLWITRNEHYCPKAVVFMTESPE